MTRPPEKGIGHVQPMKQEFSGRTTEPTRETSGVSPKDYVGGAEKRGGVCEPRVVVGFQGETRLSGRTGSERPSPPAVNQVSSLLLCSSDVGPVPIS